SAGPFRIPKQSGSG
nr:2S albumin small chain nIII - rape (fragments) [Brassica napus]